ncbi:uncharacterized protein FIBRA_03600 [Fibroporia radiculosa]|uniref:Uncharacterized protein n=1 Tax=Fibroporia radiculosa TaxID=599839 RepID=J4H2H7_9APHY|nr:uncharacterized protein FIBRA_03600 [Fibroporia radiculosa]CCM01544.1 predicted protein [Fibroporia radiculosa]
MERESGCRILVISSKIEHAERFVQRVQALSKTPNPVPSSEDVSAGITPWTISNKYYSAVVHFQTRQVQQFRSSHAEGVPAVVFVWEKGESYREFLLDASNTLRHHDPEVSLAVRFGAGSAIDPDEEEIDEFLSSNGFEFIEGERTSCEPTPNEDRHFDDEDSGIPGLPRVIDALSTIMWPSLVQSESTRNRKSRARELLDWAREEEEDDGLRALITSEGLTGDDLHTDHSDDDEPDEAGSEAPRAARKSRMQREMEELERWLAEEDGRREEEHARAWIADRRPLGVDGWQDIPTPVIKTPTTDAPSHSVPVLGFDDDFTEFVSATSPVQSAHTGTDHLGAFIEDRLVPMHTGASYRSLASVSDFGGASSSVPHLNGSDDAGEDADMPSREEVIETSRRIFGSSGPLPTPDILKISEASGSHSTVSADPSSDEHVFEHHDEDEDEFEVSAFDLSRVLSALHGMKEEIGGMSDESERRRAAARVALGLVYGLQTDRDT